jgi:Trypsin-co-occurring domain 2
MDERIAAGLAETVSALRAELAAALVEGADESLRFQLGEAQLEVQLAITKEAGADGGVRFGVVSFGAKGGLSNATTHRLTLSLQPVTVDPAGHTREALIKGWLPGVAE